MTVTPPPAAAPSEHERSMASVLPGILTCVHCGFCLPACPTYLALGDENDSPRGRILLMRAVAEGELAIDDEAVELHLDRCLGCRGCETACPSGVPYGHLLEVARDTMRREGRRNPLLARLILQVIASPAMLKPALALSRLLRATGIARLLARLPGRLGFALAMLDSTRPVLRTTPYTPRDPATRGTASLLRGCVMDGLFAHVHSATRRALRVNGYALADAPGEGCCGALHLHAGETDTARVLARANIAAFERAGADVYVVNAAGCGATMKEYGSLLADDPKWSARAGAFSARVRDVSEVVAAAAPVIGGELKRRVSYDAPCHLLHAQRIAAQPLALLASIPGLELVPLVDADQCCGAAGIYNLVEPATSEAVLAPKVAAIAATGAELIATGNPGCHMQIGAGLARGGVPARMVHPVELLDAAYATGKRA
ncbi:MAG TPA: heterodisulfide reductase-related iron-sulfur binding cluster [Gemmatimonadaceae bacterium]|nr:heterodisulfide reductase-related iron-sulfur binding cluster [Gemmatimonadaceae bacterium]